MATMTSYPNGVPSWIDLATPDPAAAKQFYGELFGWTFTDEDTDQPGVPYTMARKGEHTAAGMMLLSEEMAASGMPPVWSTYVTVDDLDAAVARVAPAGGSVMQPPMDVMTAGRMAVVADPAGAVICLWEARDHIGCEVVNEHGALTWNELTTPEPPAVAGFYADVLGWTSETAPMPSGEYTVFHVAGANEDGIAGAMAPPVPEMPTYWGIYFHVDDAAATVAAARDLGAQILMEPMTMPEVGTFATIADPQGAVFGVMTPPEAATE
ncbi:MAG TPA: VOC family protein [Acidimicrobiales bacterium]|nr:VOC family protein [Acidimicrobiales bacterium]